jgi:hypothetical protein
LASKSYARHNYGTAKEVEKLLHRPFKAATRVQIPSGALFFFGACALRVFLYNQKKKVAGLS